jgi:large subunit ribosomal protein L21
MYAIIADSGRQYRIQEGEIVDLDYRDAATGDELNFDRVLAIGGEGEPKLGAPTLEGAQVTATVVGVVAGPKLVVQYFRRRKNSRQKTGHRQLYTRVQVKSIKA